MQTVRLFALEHILYGRFFGMDWPAERPLSIMIWFYLRHYCAFIYLLFTLIKIRFYPPSFLFIIPKNYPLTGNRKYLW